jgi:pyridoxal phosphate enzyme (YggS family)
MNIRENIKQLKDSLPDHVTLVAVSKTKPVEDILEAYQAGHKVFGENRVQELATKAESLPADIEWHMVGHLQTNKVKFIAPCVHLIHSVDSLKLLSVINKEANKLNRIINVLLQIHIASEDTKFGFSEEEIVQLLSSDEYKQLSEIKVRGLMGMATFTRDEPAIRQEFRYLSGAFDRIKDGFFKEDPEFCEISMGMSGDYLMAIEEGSTMIRIGTTIFGERFKH